MHLLMRNVDNPKSSSYTLSIYVNCRVIRQNNVGLYLIYIIRSNIPTKIKNRFCHTKRNVPFLIDLKE